MNQRSAKYKTGIRRIIASVIDALVLTLPFVVISANVGLSEGVDHTLAIVNTFLPLVYSVLMHYRYGQTIGKMAMQIKVIDLSEDRPVSLTQALLRDSIWIVLQIFDFTLEQFNMEGSNYLLRTFTVITGNVALFWTLLELVTMLTNPKRRAIHDFIAGTVVIRIQ